MTDQGMSRKAARGMLLAFALAAGVPVLAQDVGDIDGLEPGVDTSATDMPAAAPQGAADEAPKNDDAAPDEPEEITRVESGGRVMDRMELGRTEITGNQELPKVLYIVPWQKPEHGALSGRPVNSLLDEVLAPVDREEFIRSVDYFNELQGNETE
jgi:hypothetical protein